MTDADVEFLKVFKAHAVLHGSGIVLGCLVLLHDAFQTVELPLDGVVLNLFEEQLGLVEHLPFRQDVGLPELLPVEGRHIEHFAQLVRRERQEGFKGDSQVAHQLQRHIEDGSHAAGCLRLCREVGVLLDLFLQLGCRQDAFVVASHRLLCAFHGLPQLPGFTVGDILVSDAGQVHGLLLSFAELELV